MIKLSIKQKILTIPVVAVLGFLIYLAFNYSVASQNSKLLTAIHKVYSPSLEIANANITRVEDIEALFKNTVITGEAEPLTKSREIYELMQADFSRIATLDPEQSQLITSLQQNLTHYYDFGYELSQSWIDGTLDRTTARDKISQKNQLYQTTHSDLEGFLARSREMFDNAITKADKASANLFSTGLVITLITIALVILTSFSVVKNVFACLAEVTCSFQEIAKGEGDLSRRIKVKQENEIGKLVEFFNSFVEKLQHSVKRIISAIEMLDSASQQLQGLSGNTQRLSAEQRNISDTVTNEIASMMGIVSRVTNFADSAAGEMHHANEEVRLGLGVVQKNVESINSLSSEVESTAEVIKQLEEDVKNVGGILDVIRSVAEQTNLLALNAAIEAARAGEHGRGFAVVADEVRTLASRTQVSTDEIQHVIEKLQSATLKAVSVMEQSREQAKESVEQATQTGASLDAISSRVAAVSSVSNQITSATAEQQRGMELIENSTHSLQETSLASVDNSNELVSVCNSLLEVADQLKHISVQFKV